METLERKELAPQEDALKLYLNSLLGDREQLPIVDDDECSSKNNQSTQLFDCFLKESNNSSEHIKRPRWAMDFFSCLPVTIGSAIIFIPLRQVRTVVPLKQNITPIKDVPDWIKGSMSSFSRSLKVVDMQKIIQPDVDFSQQTEEPSQLVLLNDGTSGISCHGVGKVSQLSVNDVIWRSKNATRRWIAGVSMTHKLIIIDARRIEYALAMESPLV